MNQPKQSTDLDLGRKWLNRAAEALSGSEDFLDAGAFARAAATVGSGFVALAHAERAAASAAEVSEVRQAILSLSDEPLTAEEEHRRRQERAEAEARPHVVDLASLPFLGFTEDGHAIGGPVPDDAQPPSLVARCGGPAVCGVCAGDVAAAVRKHQLAASVRETGRG